MRGMSAGLGKPPSRWGSTRRARLPHFAYRDRPTARSNHDKTFDK